ncbi:MAG: PAS domain S-box protein [Proteobacteria bacterium]|nr:PAS domain S-box protein [Pseudomonadota bacterium]
MTGGKKLNSKRETAEVNLDLSSVIKATQAISGEIVLESLMAKLMHAAVENAGAEQGVLILKRREDLSVEARVLSGREREVVLETIPFEECTDLSAGVIRYVARTRETVVLDDAANEGAFTHDEYVRGRRPMSILCLPILHHGELSGIFYLENNLATHAFTSDRLDVLNLLAAQAAISIENAKLYETLHESEKKHRALMEAMPDGVMVHSEGIVRFVNQKCVELLGAKSSSDIIGCEALSFIHPDYQEIATKRLQEAYDLNGLIQSIEYKLVRLDGKTIEVELSAAAVEFQGKPASHVVIRDITDRKLAERQMFRAEKMASLGQIIAGVAHEINNPNNFIFFNLPILQKYIDAIKPVLDDRAEQDKNLRFVNMPYDMFIEDIYKLLENMLHGSKRITDIVSDLKNYVRSSETEDKKPESIDAVVKQVMTLVGKQVRKNVKAFDLNLADPLPRVKMNTGKIEQVLINLVINAGQAADKEQSWVKLTTRLADMDWIEIIVEDNGSGIPEENLHSIFEPFFTTKTDELGTGLGLAISYQIIEDHGGTIEVTSEVGEGTKFTIRLPAHQGSDWPG